VSHVTSIGTAEASPELRPTLGDLEAIDASPVRCLDPEAAAEMARQIEAAQADGDSLGGCSRSSPTACPSASAPTCSGTARSTPDWLTT